MSLPPNTLKQLSSGARVGILINFFLKFDSLRPINNLSVKQGGFSWVEPVLSNDKCVLLKDHNAVTPVRLEPAAPRSRVKHSTTEPLRAYTGSSKQRLLTDEISTKFPCTDPYVFE